MGGLRLSTEQVRRLERERRLELLVLRGATNKTELCAAMDCSMVTLNKMRKNIRDRWRWNNEEEADTLREKRLAQLEFLYNTSMREFYQSKLGPKYKREVHKECGACYGAGQLEEMPNEFEPCGACKGTGVITDEEICQDEQPGDVAYLRFGKDVLMEMAKMEGLMAATVSSRTLVTQSREIGGQVLTQTEELFIQSDIETVMEARKLFAKMERRVAGKEEQRAIEHKHNPETDI